MDDLQASVESFLKGHFHIVPTSTKRHDEWYKRSYHNWKKYHPDHQDILILAPFGSREQWGSELQHLATQLARSIRDTAGNETTSTPSDGKLFEDEALDVPKNIFHNGWWDPEAEDERGLTPAMQRLSFWTTDTVKKRQPLHLRSQVRAIKALFESEQLDALIHLSKHPKAQIKESEQLFIKPDGRGWPSYEAGWGTIVDQALQVAFFVCILRTYHDKLGTNQRYQGWAPFSFLSSYDEVIIRYMDAFSKPEDCRPIPEHTLQRHWEWSLRILSISHLLYAACRLPPIEWESRIVDNFLYFLGFESINRSREGSWDLGCRLNTSKDEKWLRKTVGNASEDMVVDNPTSQSKGRRDPIFLRDPKQTLVDEPDEEEQAEMEKLAHLEAEESSYGLKRSTKYQRKGNC